MINRTLIAAAVAGIVVSTAAASPTTTAPDGFRASGRLSPIATAISGKPAAV